MSQRSSVCYCIIVLTVALTLVECTKPSNGPRKEITAEELKEHDGSDPTKPLYLSIKGHIFDVSKGRKHYGPGGGYSFFSGRDASRSFVSGCFKEGCDTSLIGLSETELADLDEWFTFYEDSKDYVFVGYLKGWTPSYGAVPTKQKETIESEKDL